MLLLQSFLCPKRVTIFEANFMTQSCGLGLMTDFVFYRLHIRLRFLTRNGDGGVLISNHSHEFYEMDMEVSGYWHTATVNCLVQSDKAMAASVSTWMGDPISMSISRDSPSDETLNRDPWLCSCEDSMNLGLI